MLNKFCSCQSILTLIHFYPSMHHWKLDFFLFLPCLAVTIKGPRFWSFRFLVLHIRNSGNIQFFTDKKPPVYRHYLICKWLNENPQRIQRDNVCAYIAKSFKKIYGCALIQLAHLQNFSLLSFSRFIIKLYSLKKRLKQCRTILWNKSMWMFYKKCHFLGRHIPDASQTQNINGLYVFLILHCI